MILNTGCRTDIPAYFSEWFMNRVREGFVMARNPYNPQFVTRYVLNPKVVKRNMRRHDPTSPLLIGHLHEDDIVHDAHQVSYILQQLSLF